MYVNGRDDHVIPGLTLTPTRSLPPAIVFINIQHFCLRKSISLFFFIVIQVDSKRKQSIT